MKLFILLLVTAALLYFVYSHFRAVPKPNRAETATFHLLKVVRLAIEGYYEEYRELSTIEEDKPAALRNSILVRILVGNTNDPVSLAANPRGREFLSFYYSHSNSNLTDGWDNPIHIAINTNSTPRSDSLNGQLRIWSNGPNGRNELGFGDDIVSDRL